MKYPITSIFRSIQGEGHFVGEVMTFVRFAGCSVLKCSIRSVCDEAPVAVLGIVGRRRRHVASSVRTA